MSEMLIKVSAFDWLDFFFGNFGKYIYNLQNADRLYIILQYEYHTL